MKKQLSILLLGASISLSSSATFAGGWEFLPVVEDDYQFKPQLSLITGNLNPEYGQEGSMTGVELAINCPLVKAPNGVIRQQISYASYNKGGVEISSFELNPYYQIGLAPDLTFGFGPGVGYIMAGGNNLDDSSLTLQAGATLNYTMGAFALGAELRYQAPLSDIKLSNSNNIDLNNNRLMLKAGYHF